jgi:hypothetical protein
MSQQKMIVAPRDPCCRQAVERYVAELAARTPLRPLLSTAEADVVFDESDTDLLCVDWAPQEPEPQEPDDWEQDDQAPLAEGAKHVRRLVEHYARTVEALAANPMAAAAFLEGIKPARSKGRARSG